MYLHEYIVSSHHRIVQGACSSVTVWQCVLLFATSQAPMISESSWPHRYSQNDSRSHSGCWCTMCNGAIEGSCTLPSTSIGSLLPDLNRCQRCHLHFCVSRHLSLAPVLRRSMLSWSPNMAAAQAVPYAVEAVKKCLQRFKYNNLTRTNHSFTATSATSFMDLPWLRPLDGIEAIWSKTQFLGHWAILFFGRVSHAPDGLIQGLVIWRRFSSVQMPARISSIVLQRGFLQGCWLPNHRFESTYYEGKPEILK